MPKKIFILTIDIDGVLIIKDKDGKSYFNDKLIKQFASFIKNEILKDKKSTYKIIIKSGSRRFGFGQEQMNFNAGLTPLILETFKASLFNELKEFSKINIEVNYFTLASLLERHLNVASLRTAIQFAYDLKTTDKLNLADNLIGNQNKNLFFINMAIKYFIDNQCIESPDEIEKLKPLTENQIDATILDQKEEEIDENEKEKIAGKIPNGNVVTNLFSYQDLGKTSCAKFISCLYGLYTVKYDENDVIFWLMADDEKLTVETYSKILFDNPQFLPRGVKAYLFYVDSKKNCLIATDNNNNLLHQLKMVGKSQKNSTQIEKIFNKEIFQYLKTLPSMPKEEGSRTYSETRTKYLKQIQIIKTFDLKKFAEKIKNKERGCCFWKKRNRRNSEFYPSTSNILTAN